MTTREQAWNDAALLKSFIVLVYDASLLEERLDDDEANESVARYAELTGQSQDAARRELRDEAERDCMEGED